LDRIRPTALVHRSLIAFKLALARETAVVHGTLPEAAFWEPPDARHVRNLCQHHCFGAASF
jgi:hypothetical protein